jgi:hypothetical protein
MFMRRCPLMHAAWSAAAHTWQAGIVRKVGRAGAAEDEQNERIDSLEQQAPRAQQVSPSAAAGPSVLDSWTSSPPCISKAP